MGSILRAGLNDVGKLSYSVLKRGKVPVFMWDQGVLMDKNIEKQLVAAASLPIVGPHVAIMPDAHVGIGCTVGSVIPTVGAIIPAAVGVDIGCGMAAIRTSLKATDLPQSLKSIRLEIEKAIPHGRTFEGGKGDKGAWRDTPRKHTDTWESQLAKDFKYISSKYPELGRGNSFNHLGTLGTGNHFIELCLDEVDRVWCVLHSGSRGVGNRIGSAFIAMAKKDMKKHVLNLPDEDLAYFQEGSDHFNDYVFAVEWAQNFARTNRQLMMESFLEVLGNIPDLPPFTADLEAVNCHHNYVARENHFGKDLFITRKGALRAGKGDLGIIPGSMGACTFIVRGKGNAESFHSCSHGAGRAMSRGAAFKKFTLADHAKATEGVECRKDAEVLDETPAAYKDIHSVMHAQRDLVEIVHTLRQVVCVKG